MKKLMTVFLLLCFLTGCSVFERAEVTGTAVPTQSSTAVTETTAPLTDLLDNKIPVDSIPHLYYVSNEAISSMGNLSEALVCGKYLAVVHYVGALGDPEDQPESIPFDLALIDLKTGEKHASARFDLQGFPTIQVAGDQLVIGCWSKGTVQLLDENLQTVQQCTVSPSWSLNHSDAAGKYIYSIPESGELTRTDAATGETQTLMGDNLHTSVGNAHRNSISLNYIDSRYQLCHSAWLNLTTNELTEMPFPGSYSYADCVDGLWLADMPMTPRFYLLGRDSDPSLIHSPGSGFQLIDGPAPVYSIGVPEDDLTQELRLYREDGSLYAALQADADMGFLAPPQWSESRNGYFLLTGGPEEESKLLFWDTANAVPDGPALEMLPLSQMKQDMPPAEAVSQELYDRAAEISRKYGIEVRIADQCNTEYDNFSAYQVIDPYVINQAMDTLVETMDSYPKGFIRQLRYGDQQPPQINLMGQLTDSNIPEDANGFTNFSAFVVRSQDRQVMVINIALSDLKQTLYHEFSHMIDAKLGFKALYRDCLYSEARWERLNPEEFRYSNNLYNVPDSFYYDGYDSYFIDIYARTNGTEDRARILEYAMIGKTGFFNPDTRAPLQQKLAYYSACIRDTFDTTGWPEVTRWEEPLGGYTFDTSKLEEMDQRYDSAA